MSTLVYTRSCEEAYKVECHRCVLLAQEDDKAKLVEETGLQLKQINNWFINQRKRNWHNNSQTSTLKSKRKR
jgi:hypothetical protein